MPTTTSLASSTDPHRHAGTDSVAWQPGRVDWFDAEKGFGFLAPDRGGPAVFCDFTAIDSPGYKTLRAGQRVVFTVTDTGRGPEAVRILTYDESVIDASSARPPRASGRSLSRRTRRALAA
ncbi:cold shock domain-containing protein [Nocardia neocaledoniensis]|uniref:cold-shock protein n=1 Tax=Nocardia neocaledoniensis TaxID=236511 RepID=UPI002458DF1A|nr:cold shock domain-containing protein [Nocardia neocaledoniensis]